MAMLGGEFQMIGCARVAKHGTVEAIMGGEGGKNGEPQADSVEGKERGDVVRWPSYAEVGF
jgi:hypothetical protein